MPVTDYETEVDVEKKTNRGPVCAECAKPYYLSAEKGGCNCPRHAERPEVANPRILAADRQAVALEGILVELQKIARKMEAK